MMKGKNFPLGAIALGYKNLAYWHRHHNRAFPEVQTRKTKAPKLLIVGWDAADWDYIEPLLAEGKMPGLQRLILSGAKGKLASMQPMLSPMLWTTIATGKRPFAHGIHGFVEKNAEGNIQPISGQSRTAAAFWDIFRHHNLKNQVVGWWPSHPAEDCNGQMISNLFHHSEAPPKGFAFPNQLESEIKNCKIAPEWITADWVDNFILDVAKKHPKKDKEIANLMHVLAGALSVQMAATYLLHHLENQTHAVYFDALDHLCHLGIRSENGDIIIEGAYRLHDRMLEGLLEYCDENTNVVLVSDHGFQLPQTKWKKLPDDPMAPEHDHRLMGVMVASGPSFQARKTIIGASIADVTPTLLAAMNLPVANDMHGRVLTEILVNQNRTAPLDSYDFLRKSKTIVSNIPAPFLKHLIELGYVDKNIQSATDKALAENQLHLARSYADALKFSEALAVLEPFITKEVPSRFLTTYLQVLIQSGEIEKSGEILEKFINQIDKNLWLLFQSMRALSMGNSPAAEEMLDQILPEENTGWWLHLAQGYLSADKPEKAVNLFKKCLTSKPADAHFGLGRIYFAEENWEFALDHFLESIEAQFFAPNVHYFIGKTLLKLGEKAHAKNALRISLQQQPLNEALRAFYQHHFSDGAAEQTDPVIVVSGLPRSGTSLAMQILQALSIEIYTDKNRLPDEHNTEGYFEHENVKKLFQNADFLTQARGQAIKITSPLLPHLSNRCRYKVIYMRRNIEDCMASQLDMRQSDHFPFSLHENLEAADQKARLFCTENQPWINHIEVHFEKLLKDTESELRRICHFLEQPFSHNLKKIVKPHLSRHSSL